MTESGICMLCVTCSLVLCISMVVARFDQRLAVQISLSAAAACTGFKTI